MTDAYPNLQPVIAQKPIDWDLIRQQYDQMVKYATALKFNTADTEAILKRFSKNKSHPVEDESVFIAVDFDNDELVQGLNIIEPVNE